MPEYRILPGTPQEAFGKLRTKLQIFGGGYGNGKTAAAVVQKVLVVARDYPGANILVARSTYPKLNDTIRKEFLKWCPKKWIKSFPLSKNADNTCTLTNGTTINFRYIAQQGKTLGDGEQTTSNLLSATYDLIVVDQLEDPEIVHKDFLDLNGRLRGTAKYIGDDPTMPPDGPRWFVVCVNPTRNWVYRTLIAPLKKYEQTGIIDPLLMVRRYKRGHPQHGEPILNADGKPTLLISLVEGSTYTNAHNLGEDFIETLESVYTGQAKDRYLYGEWASYEGLIYPDFGEMTHCIPQSEMFEYFNQLIEAGVVPRFIEGYDFGMTSPSCYLAAFVDRFRNILIFDGFYLRETASTGGIAQQQDLIKQIRDNVGIEYDHHILADPSIFKKTAPRKTAPAKSVAQLFQEGNNGVYMRRAENEISSGITKVASYLAPSKHHRHPITQQMEAPHLYVATELEFVINEFTSYMWQTDPSGERIDKPIDKNDHAMDTIKYMLSKEPDLAIRVKKFKDQAFLKKWSEGPMIGQSYRSARHG